MFLTRLKILPILIVLCLAAMSLRVVELNDGFRSVTTQSALAEEDEEFAEDEEAEAAEGEEKKEKKSLLSFIGLGGKDDKEEESEETAFEEDSDDSDEAQETAEAEPAEEVPDRPRRFRPRWVDATDSDMEFTDVKIEMFNDLTERREELDNRARQLATREALLSAAEQELDRKFQELAVIRGEIENLLEQQSEEEKVRIASLVQIYEGMKAKDAARIFDTLDLDILVSVMSQMSERKISPVMAAMNPERARTVTIMLAEQKKLPTLPGNG